MTRVPDTKRYSPLDRASVHADMRVDPEGTRRAVARQRGVLEAHRDCAECAELTPRLSHLESRRAKIAIGLPTLAEALRLPDSARPIRMYVTDDPQLLHVVFEDDALDPVPLEVAAPYTVIDVE